MTLKFHNTLTGQIDEFVPIVANEAKIYTCGPTVYDHQHIGNLAAYIYWDTLVRILENDNYNVMRVMNITDVGHLVSDADEGEDKLEKGARREGKTAWEIAKEYTDEFLNSMKELNLITPSYIAKATDFIPQQLDLVRALRQKGYTYQIEDGIYYDTSKFPSYAEFANLDLESLKAGARIGVNSEKHNVSDFAVWKFTPAGKKRDMEWETPLDLLDDPSQPRMGFPGWHLECSTIAMTFLGHTIDIHTGGIDHIPVHHTNEIAQSEAVTGVRFCNYWLHNNFLKVNGTKISKSLGNGYTLNNLYEKGFSALDFRMFVLQGHYRSEGNFTMDGLSAAKNRLQNWSNIAAIRHQIHNNQTEDGESSLSIYATSQAVVEAIENDLGTPEALRIIDEAFSNIQKAPLKDIDRQALVQLLETIDSLLGLKLIDSTPDISDEAKQIMIMRNQARENKDWQKSDELRNELQSMNIALRDTGSDSIWEYKS